MVKFWYKRINGDINLIDKVPTLWRESVRKMIVEQ